MQRNPVHRYRHRNTSLPEDMRSVPAFTTYEMVLSTRESAIFVWSTEVVSPDYPGRIGYFSKSNDMTADGGSRGDGVFDLSGSSYLLFTNTVILTEEIQTITAGSTTTNAGLASYVVGSPQSAGAGETLPTSFVLPTTPANVVDEGKKSSCHDSN